MNFITFLYHEITNSPLETGGQNIGSKDYKTNVSVFGTHLELFKNKFSTTIRVDEILKATKDSLMLTFDDGGLSCLDSARSIERAGYRGHFFIVTSFIGLPGYLSSEDIVSLHNNGHVIGTHSHTHPNIFRDLSLADQKEEWTKSKKILESLLGTNVICASIPGGDFNDDTFKSLKMSGINYVFTSTPDFQISYKFGVTIIGRVCPKSDVKFKDISKWIDGRDLRKEKLIFALKNFIKLKFIYFYRLYVLYLSQSNAKR